MWLVCVDSDLVAFHSRLAIPIIYQLLDDARLAESRFAIPYPDPNPGTIYQNNISAAVPSAAFLLIIVLSTVRNTLSYRKRRAAR